MDGWSGSYGDVTTTTTMPPSHAAFDPYGSSPPPPGYTVFGHFPGFVSHGAYVPRPRGIFPEGDYTSTTTPSPCSGSHCWTTSASPSPHAAGFGHSFASSAKYNFPSGVAFELLLAAGDSSAFLDSPTTTTTSTLPPLARKYPTRIIAVKEPSLEDRLRCRFLITVRELTGGKRQVLKRGQTKVFLEAGDDELLIKATSEDQRPPPSGLFSRLWKGVRRLLLGDKEHYRYTLPLPLACGRLHRDPAGLAADIRVGEDITSVAIRLSPEITASYSPSTEPLPFSFNPERLRRGRLAELRPCLFGMEIKRPVLLESLRLTASQREARVAAVDPRSGIEQTLAALDIPCSCRPSQLGLISWWLSSNSFGDPLVLVYFGYGNLDGHPHCMRRQIRKGDIIEFEHLVDYEEIGFWAD
ncbi:hypothetical protein Efla_007307 [Eimeria flavescens]